jgi:hypothetical protein
MNQNGHTYFYHLNGHGDVTALTDNNGAIVAIAMMRGVMWLLNPV